MQFGPLAWTKQLHLDEGKFDRSEIALSDFLSNAKGAEATLVDGSRDFTMIIAISFSSQHP
jgi:hypothetical protein